MEQGTHPFFVEQQPNVLGLPPLSDPSSSSSSDMMPFELSTNQSDSFPFVQDIPLPPFMQSAISPHYVMHPIQAFKGFAPPPLSFNPQHFFHPSNMINNANGTAPPSFSTPPSFSAPPFFVPPAAVPTTPISTSAIPQFHAYVPPGTGRGGPPMDEPDPIEKELAAILSADGALDVVDRVASFKNLMLLAGASHLLMFLMVLQNKHTSKACLRRFVDEGGIVVLHDWLSDAKKDFPKRSKFILRLLDTLAVLPISLEVLKKSQLGKTVKTMSKLNDPEISDKAQKLVSSWMGLVTPVDSTSSQSSADAPRKRSLAEAEQGAKKKTKMAGTREDPNKTPTKTQNKPPSTPPKGTILLPTLPTAKHKALPKPAPSQTTQVAPATTSQQPPHDDEPGSKPKPPTGRSSGGDDLMNQLNASKKVAGASSAVSKKKIGRGMQLIEVAAAPVKKIVKPTYEQKPLSADAIHKAKLKEMLLARPSDTSATPPTSPPSPSPPSSPPSSPPVHSSVYSPAMTDSVPTSSSSLPSSTFTSTAVRTHTETPGSTTLGQNTVSAPYPGVSPFSSDGGLPSADTTSDVVVEKEPDPNRRRSNIKNPRVTWASDEKLTDVREYVVDEEPSPPVGDPVSSLNASQAEQHRSFESARLHELQQERSTFMHMKSEEDNWRTSYQEMRPREGLVWPRAHALVEFPPDFAPTTKGEESEEVKVQRAREAQELMVIYKDNRMAPDSPREPAILETDYDDSKTSLIHWDEPTSTPTPSPTVSASPVPNIAQLQNLINLTQAPQQGQSIQPQNQGIDAILALLGGQQFPPSVGDIGNFNNPGNNDPNSDIPNNNSYNIHSNHGNPNSVNNNSHPFNPGFSGPKQDNVDNIDNNNNPNLPFKHNNNPPNTALPNPMANLKNYGLFNFGGLGNLLSQFPPNQIPLGLLNPALKVNPSDPSFLSALAGLPAANNMFNSGPMNDRGKYGRMCTYFNTPTGCRNGNQCKFSHVQPLHSGNSHSQFSGDYGKPHSDNDHHHHQN